jgi:hypothetical protein
LLNKATDHRQHSAGFSNLKDNIVTLYSMKAPSGVSDSYTLANSKNPGAVDGSFSYTITDGFIQADAADAVALYDVGFTVIMNAPAGLQSIAVPSTAEPTIVTSITGLKTPVCPQNVVYTVSGGQIFANPGDIPQLYLVGFRVVA